MVSPLQDAPAAWTAAELEADRPHWLFTLDDRARCDLVAALTRALDPDKTLFDYRRGDFDLGAAGPVIAAAFAEMQHGRGYNSNAELDFHTDSTDVVALSCYNRVASRHEHCHQFSGGLSRDAARASGTG